MLSQEEVFQYLVGLPDTDYANVVFRAESNRQQRLRREFAEEVPAVRDRDTAADWVARQHLAVDPGVAEVYYLGSAPADEIRLIEVNRLLPIPDPPGGRFEFVDFGFDIDQLRFSLSVIDMTGDQLQKTVAGALHLPDGWSLHPHAVYRREA